MKNLRREIQKRENNKYFQEPKGALKVLFS